MQASFSGGTAYADGNAMGYETAGQYCVKGKPGAPRADILPIYSPGIYGGIPKNYAAGEMEINIEVCYVAGSEQECESLAAADAQLLGKTTNDLILGNVPYKSCRLVKFDEDQPRFTARNGNWRMDVLITVNSMDPWQ